MNASLISFDHHPYEVTNRGDALQVERVLQQIVEVVRGGARPAYLDAQPSGNPTLRLLSTRSDQAQELLQVEIGGRIYSLVCWSRHVAEEPSCLSPREREVVRLVARGLPNKTIAFVLQISTWTVATYMRRIFTKLEVSSRAEMVAKALKQSMLAVGDFENAP
ncbi:MAG: helix-turn-helix transcriptional regulator [Chloroflexia bacterium]